MSGIYSVVNGKKPTVGEKVILFVDTANHPSGEWLGEITEVLKMKGLDEEGSWSACKAIITDPRAPENYHNSEPYINYDIADFQTAAIMLLSKSDKQKAEINGLKKHHKITLEALYGAMRAMVSPEATTKLEELIALLLKKK